MVAIRQERPADVAAREALLDVAYGPVRLWQVSAGRNRPALLLGPLTVHPSCRKRGIGSTLVQHALREAARRRQSGSQFGAVLLVGDAPYYGRFGFSSAQTGALWLP